MTREQLLTVIALMVASTWAVTALASLITKEYTPLTIVTTVMVPVVAFLYAVKKNGSGEH